MDSVVELIQNFLPEDSELEPEEIQENLEKSLRDRNICTLHPDLAPTI
jgi:hypothetical protein